jgi:hypothetical protein
MFLLNRHAKWLERKNAEPIYDLKNAFLKLLWDQGFCVLASIAMSPPTENQCWGCDGTGRVDDPQTMRYFYRNDDDYLDDDLDDDEYDDDDLDDDYFDGFTWKCRRCSGSGIYSTSGGREYWAFVFVIDGRKFSWHQPKWLCHWATAVGDPQPDHEVLAEIKQTRRFKVSEAMALVRWVVDQSA